MTSTWKRLAVGAALCAGAFLAEPRDAVALYGNTSYYWPGNAPLIPVCWENPTSANATAREWVRDAVERNWARFARLNFTGWGQCTSGAPGLHILHTNNNQAPGGYPGLNGVTNGVQLDLSRPEGEVRALALHEFGHALGFYHEEERPDYNPPAGTTGPCAKQFWPNGNPQYYGAYDINSVMSYCGQPPNDTATWKQTLGAGDIAAAQRAYGRRIAGTLLSPRANALSANRFVPAANGAVPFLWDADEFADDQEWRRNLSSSNGIPKEALYLYPSGAPGFKACLHMVSTTNGTQIEIRDCINPSSGSTSPQKWTFDNIEIRGYGGQCLDLQNGNTTTGTPVQMWRCLGNINQKWSITSKGEIKFGALTSGKCVKVSGGSTADGTRLQIASCDGSQSQKFTFASTGEIKYSSGGVTKCVDVQAALDSVYLSGQTLPYDGAPLQIFTCLSQQRNQKWNFSGAVKARGKCLDRPWPQDDNGLVPWTWDCNGTIAQVWDYYVK